MATKKNSIQSMLGFLSILYKQLGVDSPFEFFFLQVFPWFHLDIQNCVYASAHDG